MRDSKTYDVKYNQLLGNSLPVRWYWPIFTSDPLIVINITINRNKNAAFTQKNTKSLITSNSTDYSYYITWLREI